VWEVDLQTRATTHPPESQRIGFVPAVPAREVARLVIDVVDADGRPVDGAFGVAVSCPGFDGGPPGEYDVEPGPCALRAERRDGALVARGPVATVVVGGADPAYLQLEVPMHRSGGIGIRFEPVADGMRVVEVAEGTPADVVGIEPGDTIVAVSGLSVAGMEPERFVEEVTGEEGTPVELTFVGAAPGRAEEDSGLAVSTVRLTRAYLDG
jgi:S1-C subfamily serine protease